MNYGYFDDKNREYVITNPMTPIKWINYVGTLNFGGFVDHTGGSLICKGDPALNRIVKYIPQLPSSNFKGETLYLRLKKDQGYKIFSPYFVPTLDDYDKFECRVGLQYTKYTTEFYGIKTEIIVFIPIGENRLIRDIRITNLNEETVVIDAIPVVEYTHFDALKQFTNADWCPQTLMSKLVDEGNGNKVLSQYAFKNKGVAENYFTSNMEISSIESDRKIFLGDNEYGTWQQPKSLLNEELSNTEALRGDNIGALMHHLGEIKSGETVRLITQLGQTDNIENELANINKFRDGPVVDQEMEKLATFWDGYLSKYQTKTPDASLNTMINIHNARQCYITKNWSRYLSLYQLGLGARGLGFRDSSQDVMGVLGNTPEEGRELIEMILHVQKRDGSAMHQFNPKTMIANEGDSREHEDRPNYYGDDHLWIIMAVCAYIKETGNYDFLNKEIPFYEKDSAENVIESGTVLEHLLRGIEFTYSNVGQHGLPLLGFADWNDTVNLRTGAESVFIANQFGVAIGELIGLLKELGKDDIAGKFEGYYDTIKNKVNEHCWDGEWFVRYFDSDGSIIGSSQNQEGKIYTNAQSWSVMSGFAEGDRAVQALDSVNKYLNTSNGIKLSYPGYNGYDEDKGGVTTYPPGTKENGGIFLHSNPWVMIAETKIGRGDRAYQYYNQINPATKNEKIDEFESAPYNYPQNILGDEHPQFGLGRNSWLSGTASWTFQAATKFILGIRPDYSGLIVDPCIPKDWREFTVTREFRGATYIIQVKNPDGVCKGVKSMIADGVAIAGNLLPVYGDGQTHAVEVIMG
ncbi:hypothetical protein QUF58_11550, partial [Anaerolineales bacterium HSG24]|nr:hypothetical protein [Anaerolineales bacterium HSG24]